MLPAATAALLLATPLFGSTVVSAELLGLPFVLAGIAAALVSLEPDGPGLLDVVGDRRRCRRGRGVPGQAEHRGRRRVRGRDGRRSRVGGRRACGSWAAPPSVRWRWPRWSSGWPRPGAPARPVSGTPSSSSAPRRPASSPSRTTPRPASGWAGCWSPSCSAGRRCSPARWPGRRPGAPRARPSGRAAVRRVGAAGLGDVRGAGRRRLLAALPDGAGPRAGRAGRRLRAGGPPPLPLARRGVRLHGLLHRGRPVLGPGEPDRATGGAGDRLPRRARAPRGHRRRRVRHPEHPPGRGAAEPVPPALEPARPGARPGGPRAGRRTDRAGGADLAGGLGSVGDHVGDRRRGREPRRPRRATSRPRTPASSGSTSGRTARDRGPRRRPSPDAHAPTRAGRRDGRVRGAAGAVEPGGRHPERHRRRGAVGVVRHHRLEHRRADGASTSTSGATGGGRCWSSSSTGCCAAWRTRSGRRCTTRCRSASTSGWAAG